MINNKYEMVHNDTIEIKRTKLRRIRALKDFGDVKAGDLGGYIENYSNLNYLGNCWIYNDAKVYGKASIREDAKIKQNARAYDKAIVTGRSIVMGEAKISGDSVVDGMVVIDKEVRVAGAAKISENARLTDNAIINGAASIYGTAHISGQSLINGKAKINNIADINNMCFSEGLISYSVKDNNFDNFMYLTAFRKHITVIRLSNNAIMVNIDGYAIDINSLKNEIKRGLLPDKLKDNSDELLNTILYIECIMGR